MPKLTYEIPAELLRELMCVCDLATAAWDYRKENCTTNKGAVEASENGWLATEAWRWLNAIKNGEKFTPIAFGEVHCENCGDRKDVPGVPHFCLEERL